MLLENLKERTFILEETGIDISKAESKIELKDGRYLLTFHNGFSYWELTKNKKLQEVSESWYKTQLKHRKTKRHGKTTKRRI